METEEPRTDQLEETVAVVLLPATKEDVEKEGKFPIVRQELKELAASVAGLTIADVNDKAGMKAVDDGRKLLKRKIALIRSTGKMARDGANKYAKAVIELENELVEELEPTKKVLEERYDTIEAERGRLREEERQREHQRIQDRLNLLRNVGADMDYHELLAITDERFDLVLKEATEAFEQKQENDRIVREAEEREEAERQRIAEEKAEAERKELEELRIRQEKEREFLAEQKRIQDETKAKFEEQQRRFEEEKAKMEAERQAMEKAKLDLRITRLKAYGFTWTGISVIYQAHQRYVPVKITVEQIRECDDDTFEGVVTMLLNSKREHDDAYSEWQKEEKERKDREAEEERKRKEEADKKAKEEALIKAAKEEQERLAQGDDGYRFANLAQQIEVSFLNSSIWGHMKSAKGKDKAESVKLLLKNAYEICKDNARNEPAA